MKFASAFGVACAAFAIVNAVPITHDEIEANSAEGLRLLTLEDGAAPVWKTEDEKLDLMRAGVQFFDVTDTWEYKQSRITTGKLQTFATFPSPSKTDLIAPLTAQLSTDRMNSYLTNLTAFNNRYYKSSTGVAASTFIRDLVASFATGNASVALFPHTWVQSSIIAKIPGTDATGPVTVIGAHMDSINLSSPTNGRAPGADDDGTGSVNLIEIFRVLNENNFQPSTPVEFHWYSGEEGGLLGSQAVATAYDKAGVTVKAMLELDMTGYVKPGTTPIIGLITDFTDAGLTTWLNTLIPLHSNITVTRDKCGYACSDHASWFEFSHPTAFTFESLLANDDPRIHGSGDTTAVAGFSWDHSLQFARMGLAYIYEMSA
ncbi:Zn-dependent exopeptidase [Mycena rebaudengoi]|nr:Zn-dependent exopeptidase [Mycena rebaudengoi]